MRKSRTVLISLSLALVLTSSWLGAVSVRAVKQVVPPATPATPGPAAGVLPGSQIPSSTDVSRVYAPSLLSSDAWRRGLEALALFLLTIGAILGSGLTERTAGGSERKKRTAK